ncbi:MAG: hypothetical protein WCJ03_04965 [Bacteroidales bacterium]
MSDKEFNCKQEDVPAISGIVALNYLRDIAEFNGFSSEFTEQLVAEITAKRTACLEMTKSSEVIEQQKSVTQQIVDKIAELRIKLNKLEGYLDLADKTLDLPIAAFGIATLRENVRDKNIEGIVFQGNTTLTMITRNAPQLAAKGMKADFTPALKALIDELDSLKIAQKGKKSERAHTAESNIVELNELWALVTKILKAAQAIYRGENDLKLKDYTMSHLKKQIRPKTTDDKGAEAIPAVK